MKKEDMAESPKNESLDCDQSSASIMKSELDIAESDSQKAAQKIVKKYDAHVLSRDLGKGRTIEYMVAIAINIVLLYLLARISDFSIPFLTDDFMFVIPAFRISLIATIIGNTILLIYDRRGFREIIHILLNVAAIYVLYQLYFFFPFNLPADALEWFPFAFKNVFLIAIGGVAIATIFEAIQIFHD